MTELNNTHQPLLNILDNGIAQIAVLVPDLDQAVRDYYHTFGIGPWHFYTYQRPLLSEITYYGKQSEHAFRIALSYFGPMRIELIELVSGENIHQDFLDEHGYGVHHLGILVEDMESALQQVRAAGFEIIQSGKGFGPDGDGHYAYLSSEEQFSVIFELIERPKRRHAPEAIFPPNAE